MPEIAIRTLQPQPTIASRHEIPRDQLSTLFDRELPRVGSTLAELGASMAGPPFARYHAFGEDRVDVEVGAPIADAPAGLATVSGRPDGIIGASTLPGGPAAVAMHVGSYDALSETYDALAAWIAAERPNGMVSGAGPWEVYLTDPRRTPDPADWRTEVVWPLEQAPGS